MKSRDDLSVFLFDRANELAEKVVTRVCDLLTEDVSEEERQRARTMYVELWKAVAETLRTDKETIPESLLAWSRSNAAMQTENGGSISLIAKRYPISRDVLADLLLEISEKRNMTIVDYVQISKQMHRMLDCSLNETYYAFERLSMLYRSDTEEELAALSAPVVPVYDGIVVIPFIGRITDDRAYAIINNVLPRVATMDVDCLIADFSGLAEIDDRAMQSLKQIEASLDLMGIQVISTGLRPQLAQKIVNAGYHMAGTRYYATVKQALQALL